MKSTKDKNKTGSKVVNLTPNDSLWWFFSGGFSETLDRRSRTVWLQRSGEESELAAS